MAMSDKDFIELCAYGTVQEISEAIRDGANVNARDNCGRTALIKLVENYEENISINRLDSNIMRILFDAGADINVKNDQGRSAFDIAHEDWPDLYPFGGDYYDNVTWQGKFPILHWRSPQRWNPQNDKEKKHWMLSVMLEMEESENFRTGLHTAAYRIWKKLMSAVERGDIESVKAMLEHGLDVNMPKPASFMICGARWMGETHNTWSSSAETALMKAAQAGDIKMVRFLVEHGADVGLRLSYGDSALTFAADKNAVDVIEFLLSVYEPYCDELDKAFMNAVVHDGLKAAEMFLQHGANIDAHGSYYEDKYYLASGPAISIAAAYGYVEMMKMLLDYGADADSKNPRGKTALMMAAESSCPRAVEILLEHGANVNAVDDNGYTALLFAVDDFVADVRCRKIDTLGTVKILLGAGADVNAMNNHGETALDLACYEDGTYNAEVVKILEVAGAKSGDTAEN